MRGVFNIAQRPVAEIVPLSSFTGAVPTLDYVVRSFRTEQVSPRIKCGDVSALLSVSLDTTGYDILTATPLALFPGDRFRHIWVGNMGLLGKMTGCAAIVSNQMWKRENKRLLVDTRLKALGVLGKWSNFSRTKHGTDKYQDYGSQPCRVCLSMMTS